MSHIDYIISSLKNANISIDKLSTYNNIITYHLSTTVSTQSCPCCGNQTSFVHDYRNQLVKDLPFNRQKIYLLIRKRRYVCNSCGKRFYEHLNFLQKYKRVTNRVRQSIYIDLHHPYSMKDIALKHNVSQFFVQNVLNQTTLPTTNPIDTIAIDEFKGNADREKFQTILTDPSRKTILNILPDRNKLHLDIYFQKLPHKDRIKYVIMDMWRPYYDLAKHHFKNATIIIDRYHFIRQVTWALENVRKRVQRHLCKEERIFFKRSKKLLLAKKEDLSIEELDMLYVMFSHSEDLRVAYELKNIFYSLLKLKDKKEVKQQLIYWIQELKESGIKEFGECIRAFSNWLEPIINGITEQYNNAYTEGKNNKTKVLKRISYGIRTFKNLQKRILLINKNFHFQAI